MAVSIPRISMENLPPALAEALAPRVKRLGYLGEFFQVGALQPAPLLDFLHFTENAKKGLPQRLVELVALTASMVARNDYERHQHERLCVKLGFGEDWVRAVEALEPDALDDPSEAVVQRLVLAALRDWGHGVETQFEAVVEQLGPEATIALLFVIGRYLVHAMFVNTLGLRPPVPSIFDDGAHV